MRSPLKWVGGKNLLAPEIIKRFPKHNCYVEPFCGGCNVILQKGPSTVEIVNDVNADLVNFLLVLKDRPEELYHECEALPYSQYLYEKWKWEDISKEGLERAVRFFYCDPPYVGHEELYQGGFKKEDHQRLANTLNSIKGRAMISYYEEPLIDELYPGWHKEKFIRSSTIRNIGDGEKLPRRTELLLTNYIEGRNMVLFEQEVGS